jgi:FHA domain-containing protein/GAF domain-containing protein
MPSSTNTADAPPTIRLRVEPPGSAPFEREYGGVITIGRSGTADITIADEAASRQHARLFFEQGCWVVEDLGARNGTGVNGERLIGKRALVPGDLITIGGTIVKVLPGYLTGPAVEVQGLGALGTSIVRPISGIFEADTAVTAASPEDAHAALKALNDFHAALAASASVDAVIQLLVGRVFALLQPEEAVVLLMQADGSLTTAAGRREDDLPATVTVSRRLIGDVLDRWSAALVTDVGIDGRFAGAESGASPGMRSIVAAPLGEPPRGGGLIAAYTRARVRAFTERDLELLLALASAASLRMSGIAPPGR